MAVQPRMGVGAPPEPLSEANEHNTLMPTHMEHNMHLPSDQELKKLGMAGIADDAVGKPQIAQA